MILSLKKSLEAEQLKSMTLAQELEMKKSSILDSQQPPGFFSSRESMIPRGPWQNAVPPPDISTSDGDLLGLRSMVPGPWSGEIVPSKPSTAQSLLPPSSSQGSSFLQSSHRGAHDLFGGLGLGSTSEFQSILGLPRSGSPPGLIQVLLASQRPLQRRRRRRSCRLRPLFLNRLLQWHNLLPRRRLLGRLPDKRCW